MSAPAVAPATPPTTLAQTLRSFDVEDFPQLTGREEQWRFTPLKRLRGLDRLTLAEAVAAAAAAPTVTAHDLPDGVSLTQVGRDDPRIGSVMTPFDRISALAYGAATSATVISVAPGTTCDRPALVEVAGTTVEAVAFGSTLIEVGASATATLVIRSVGHGTLADNVEVDVADGANLTLVTVAGWEPDAVQAQHLRFRLGRDARVDHVQVTLGGDLVRQYTSVDYTAAGGDCQSHGVYFATAGQHIEHRLLVDHSVPNCRSYVGYRGALSGAGAHTVWVGDVLIRAEATGTDTYEINRNLVLTDGTRADSVPNLEIETGEVAGAGHASTTGRFDDEQLFYLMARGIPEAEARRLVVRGFFAELLDRIPVAQLREDLLAQIEANLGEAGA